MKAGRGWLAAALAAAALAAGAAGGAAEKKPVRVVVWDEQQPTQKAVYPDFMGNHIAQHLRKRADFQVRSVRLDDPEQGLSAEVLDQCDVLLWWGHARHGEIRPETAKALVERIRAGRLALVAIHSAHWSVPFIEAMNQRTIDDALAALPEAERPRAQVRTVKPQMRLYRKDEPLTPSVRKSTGADGTVQLDITLPSCVFSRVRADGKPGRVRTLLPAHPIARGIPAAFDIPQTEVYDGPFHVPTPDAVVFEERWDDGGQFPSGCVWRLGKGRVFYFRPGHETFPVFHQPETLRILENAVDWLGRTR